MPDTTTRRYLNTADAARYLAIGQQTLPKLRLRASGPSYLKFGRSVTGRVPMRRGPRSRSVTFRGYDSSPVIEQFQAALARRGLELRRQLIADGRIHRCDVKGKHGHGDGSYLLHLDGTIPTGGYQNWQDGAGWEDWRYDPGRDLTNSEQAEFKQKVAAARRLRDEEESRNRANAREKAAWHWADARPAVEHHYLQRKQIAAHGTRVKCDYLLLVPMYDEFSVLHNVQLIWPNGKKRYLRGGRVKGCFYRIAGDSAKSASRRASLPPLVFMRRQDTPAS
jgi:phage/plasmid primase-like uncharacterized protein